MYGSCSSSRRMCHTADSGHCRLSTGDDVPQFQVCYCCPKVFRSLQLFFLKLPWLTSRKCESTQGDICVWPDTYNNIDHKPRWHRKVKVLWGEKRRISNQSFNSVFMCLDFFISSSVAKMFVILQSDENESLWPTRGQQFASQCKSNPINL